MNIKQKSFKYIILSMLMMFMTFCILAIKPIDVSAHDGYFLAIAFDTDSKSYIGTIAFQSNSIIGDNHAEVKVSTNLSDIDRDGKKPPYIDYNTVSEDDIANKWADFDKTDFSDNDEELLFTFPGMHYKTQKLDANGADELLAERVCNVLIPQLNACIDFIIQETEFDNATANDVRTIASKLSRVVTIKRDDGASMNLAKSSITVNGKTVSFSVGADKSSVKNLPDGITYKDYLIVKIGSKSQPFIYQCWKGYNYPSSESKKADPLARDTNNKKGYKDGDNKTVYKIGWNAIIAQAHINLDLRETGFSNLGDVLPSSALVNAVASLCDWAITGIRSFLGLYALDELMLNTGTRGMTYSMGLFPNGWVAPIYLMYTVCLMIVWAVMGFAVIKIFMKRQLATINIGEKMNIMNELKNLVVCCFLLGAFPLVFNMLARINQSLVDLFAASTAFPNMIKSFYTLSQSSMGSIVACFAGLALQIYFNFFYILRAITVAVLYAIAPLCIYTVVLGGKNSKVFGAWMKELLSNIFVQTIHALMIAFFTSVSAINGLRTFESLVVLYSFIPLTKFVKQNVFQTGEGITGMAGGLASGLSSAASGFATGAASGGASGGSSSSGGGSNGSGGGNFGSGTGMMADRMAKSNDRTRKPVGNSLKDDVALGVNSPMKGTLSNWSNGVNGNGESVGKVKQNIGNLASNAYDKSLRFKNVSNDDYEGINGKSGFTSPNKSMVNIANTKPSSIALSAAKSTFGTGVKVAGGLAMGGMALGTASFDEASGARMMRNATSFAGNQLANGINKVKGDVKTQQYLKNHGASNFNSDGTYDFYKLNMKYDKENHKMTPYDPNSGLTKDQWNLHSKMMEANDPKSNMSLYHPKEAAYYRSKSAARGMSYGLDKNDGSVVVRMDKTNPNYQRNGLDAVHTSVPQYNEEIMGGGRQSSSNAQENDIPTGYTKMDNGIVIKGDLPKDSVSEYESNSKPSQTNFNSSPSNQKPSNTSRENESKIVLTRGNLSHEQMLQMVSEGQTPKETQVTEQMRLSKENKKNNK